MSDTSPILVIAEAHDGAPSRLTCELLALARRLQTARGTPVVAACFGDRDRGITNELIARGADRAQSVEHPALAQYQSEAWVSAAAQLCRAVKPALVLMGHTSLGGDLAPRLAFRLDGSAATGCVEIAWHDDRYALTRACQGGNVRETLSICDRAYIIKDGTILREGKPSEIAADPTVREIYLGQNFQLG